MAVTTQIANLNVSSFVTSLSRYQNSEVIYWGPLNIITFTTYKKQKYPLASSDKYTVVSPGAEYRPDKVSQAAYGTPDFWWKIMEANGIMDIFDFKAGTNIRLPGNIYS